MENRQKLKNYYSNCSKEDLKILILIKDIINKIAPDAIEVYKWGMPVFELNGKYLIGINATKKHIALYPGAEPIKLLSTELMEYQTSKGTIKLSRDRVINRALLIKILNLCKK